MTRSLTSTNDSAAFTHADMVKRLTGGKLNPLQLGDTAEGDQGGVTQMQQGIGNVPAKETQTAKKSLKLRPVKRQPYRR